MEYQISSNNDGGLSRPLGLLNLSASARVFIIPELLKLILLHVPTLQLLVIQRVNTSFQDIIKTSSPLQEKLFFKAESRNSNVSHVEWNPFMRKSETSWERSHLQQTLWGGCRKIRMPDFTNVDPNASWLRMLVCQPPRPMVEMMRFNLVSSGYLSFLAVIQMEDDGEGCRMSDIHKYGWHDDDLLGDDCYVRVDC